MAVPIDMRGKGDWREASTMCIQSGLSLGFKMPNSKSVLLTLPQDKPLILSSDCSAGSIVAKKVTQVQSMASRQEGEKLTLDCSYETSQPFYDLFWYKQLLSGEMVFLIRQMSSSTAEERSGRYSVVFQRSLKSISLVISALQPDDSGKYFCALWELTQCLKWQHKLNKNWGSFSRAPLREGAQLRSTPAHPEQEGPNCGCCICGLHQNCVSK